MGTLFLILGGLFLALIVISMLAERFAKPVSSDQQQRYSQLIMLLMFLVMIGSGIRYLMD